MLLELEVIERAHTEWQRILFLPQNGMHTAMLH